MPTDSYSWLHDLLPAKPSVPRAEQVRASIMSTHALTAQFSTELGEAWRTMRYHQVQAMPVLNRARRVIGMVSQGDFLRYSDLDDFRTLGARLRQLIRRTGHTHSEKPEVVGQIMSADISAAFLDTPIVELVPLMANSGLHHIPVLDAERRFAGIVTQSDIVADLVQRRLAEGGRRRRQWCAGSSAPNSDASSIALTGLVR